MEKRYKIQLLPQKLSPRERDNPLVILPDDYEDLVAVRMRASGIALQTRLHTRIVESGEVVEIFGPDGMTKGRPKM